MLLLKFGTEGILFLFSKYDTFVKYISVLSFEQFIFRQHYNSSFVFTFFLLEE